MSSLAGNAAGHRISMKKTSRILGKRSTVTLVKRSGRQSKLGIEESLSSGESEMSTERTPSPTPNECNSPKLLENIKGKDIGEQPISNFTWFSFLSTIFVSHFRFTLPLGVVFSLFLTAVEENNFLYY